MFDTSYREDGSTSDQVCVCMFIAHECVGAMHCVYVCVTVSYRRRKHRC